MPVSSSASRANTLNVAPFADRLTALVEERKSQVCLGLDPDPAGLEAGAAPSLGGDLTAAEAAATAIASNCAELIAAAGPSCVAVKPQLACFERLGAPGWGALASAIAAAHEAGLLVIADGKRGDVPVSAKAYAQALFGATESPWGTIEGLGADAATANPLIGADALEPLITGAATAHAGIFALVRTSNPGAADILDLETTAGPVHEHLARLVDRLGVGLMGECGLSGLGAVVGATAPKHLGRLRELMPRAIFLVPGVGAQGGKVEDLGPAFAAQPASVLVAASRSLAGAADPGAAAEDLRKELWQLSQATAR